VESEKVGSPLTLCARARPAENDVVRPTFFSIMPILPQKGLLAIAAVVNVALQKDGLPVSAKTIAARHGLPSRHLESVLQSLVHGGILKGVRGPHGGYKLARERDSVTAQDILSAACANEVGNEPNSELLTKVVLPVLSFAEQEFKQALTRISLDDMLQRAVAMRTKTETASDAATYAAKTW
jgi:Rrf2 family transcriptional regulator, iron-sulfur cluster assembly transcription factor